MGVGHAGGVSGNSKYARAAATPSTHARMHAYARDQMSSGTEATTMNRGGQAGGWRRSSLRCRRRARGRQGRSGSSESTTAAVSVEDEDGDGGDAAGLLRSRASVCSSTESWRSSWWRWLGGWWPIATAMATARSRAHRKRGRGSQRRGENKGRLWASPWRREDVGEAATAKQEVEASACARATSPLPTGRG